MNKILFDLSGTQPSDSSKRHGGAKYGEMIIARIIERNLPVSCCYDFRKWINPDILNMLSDHNISVYDTAKRTLEQIVEDENVKLIYTPLSSIRHIRFNKCKVLGTIHDVRPLEKSIDPIQIEYKPWNNFYRYILKKLFKNYFLKRKERYFVDAITSTNFSFVTVSYHSAYALKCYFPQLKNVNIPVFYSPSISMVEILERKYQENFFLLVSGERFVKNILRAVKALDRLFDYGYASGMIVKITGLTSSNAFWYNIRNKERFEFLGFTDDVELAQLYHDAYCLIFPSLSEGFGYPPLEAMHFGTPVIASPITSISEVCGGHVLYFNPFSVEEIMNRILQMLQYETHCKYSELAKERYQIITKKQNKDLDGLIDYIFSF